ncbi:hypothetical protein CYY_004385 [Polysphondylium violaceum]|uniref:tRNA-splicing endonuclease subunit Sen15 domain-containing protein n=1 Tax=Polysphondylium violaceum TaxID=133409 RepID=A0A8J4Q5F5_9MYCE|nr:hypothetical protein CYY_004385 [Polysphondylium violaceum]
MMIINNDIINQGLEGQSKILESIKNHFKDDCTLDQIHLCFQLIIDLMILKKWYGVQVKSGRKTNDSNEKQEHQQQQSSTPFLYLKAFETSEDEKLKKCQYVVPTKSASLWSLCTIKKYFEIFGKDSDEDGGGKELRKFTTAIQDGDGSVTYYQLSKPLM